MITVGARGGHRTGPSGAWWAWLTPRPQRGGFGLEVPRGRAAGWNAVILACLAAALAFGQGRFASFLVVIGGAAAAAAVAIYVIWTGHSNGWLGFQPPADAGDWQEPDADDEPDEWQEAA